MLKLLIVDDEIEICDFVKSFFKERDFDVVSAHNGSDALNLIETSNPDIILLDLLMPIMDGIELLKNLKERNSSIKAIMVTAIDELSKIDEAKKYGAVDYITKPLLLEDLERAVRKVADQFENSR